MLRCLVQTAPRLRRGVLGTPCAPGHRLTRSRPEKRGWDGELSGNPVRWQTIKGTEHVACRRGDGERGHGMNNTPDGTCARNLTCIKGSHDNIRIG